MAPKKDSPNYLKWIKNKSGKNNPNFGKKLSQETKDRISKSKTGHKLPPFTEEHRKNMGLARLGKKLSAEHIRKLSESHKGYKMPQSQKDKIGLFNKGKITSIETRIKMSIAEKLTKGLKNKNSKYSKDVDKQIRMSIEYRLWRESVFARDNYTCQKCYERGGKLRAHHIQNFSQFPELRFAIDNGITLSDKEHIKFHKIYGKQNNTKEQIEEFLKQI